MSIESAFRRLVLQPASICRQCRRSWSSSSVQRQQQSATAAFTGQLLASRNESTQSRSATIRSSATPISTPPKTSAEPDKPVPRTSYDIASSIISDTAAASRRRAQELRASEIERPWSRSDLERQTQRRWRVGDVYAPHDLSGAEQAKWKKFRRKGKQRHDDIDQLGINPIHHYKNFAMMSEYVTDMGRIKHSNETGLRPRNQRRMAKAIRRAIGTGMMPGVYRHPEILRVEMKDRRSL